MQNTVVKRIRRLDEHLIAQIAAGEVIESPAAIVKELVENSLDAEASEIDIRFSESGFGEIQVRDNGVGIDAEDLPLAVESFATSKISSVEELMAARTMGFRGEALGSISAVSRLTLESKTAAATAGALIAIDEAGQSRSISPIVQGTRVVVKDLFYNVPVRRDYYQNPTKIRRELEVVLTNITAANYGVDFRYQFDDEPMVHLPMRPDLLARLKDIWGDSIETDLVPIYYAKGGLNLSGYISKFYFYSSHGSDTRLWVNERPVNYRPLLTLLRNAYGELMPKGRFPFAALFLAIDPENIDVNVHPQKREIRFRDEIAIQNFLREAFTAAISAEGGMKPSRMMRITKPADIMDDRASRLAETDRFDFSPSLAQKAAFAPAESPQSMPEGRVFPADLQLHSRIFNTFIVATNDSGLYLIDQHTAHERINYETFLRKLASGADFSQRLMHPMPLSAAIFDRSRITKSTLALAKLGFELEDLGPAGLALLSVPVYISAGEEENAFATAIKIVEAAVSAGAKPDVLFDQLAKDLSCRHAIRKGEVASLQDFRELVAQLSECENPMRCPHGRPTIVKLDAEEIFAFFKRSV
jgi:DNA mismatch repair protein MutL